MLVRVRSRPWHTSRAVWGSVTSFSSFALAYIALFLEEPQVLMSIGVLGGMAGAFMSLSARTRPLLPVHFLVPFETVVRLDDEEGTEPGAEGADGDHEEDYRGDLAWLLERRLRRHWPWGETHPVHGPPAACPVCGARDGGYDP